MQDEEEEEVEEVEEVEEESHKKKARTSSSSRPASAAIQSPTPTPAPSLTKKDKKGLKSAAGIGASSPAVTAVTAAAVKREASPLKQSSGKKRQSLRR
jgi:hypothetical protein